MVDKTKEMLVNKKVKSLFLLLEDNYLSDAMRRAGFKSYPHALNISRQFMNDGYFSTVMMGSKKVFKITKKGILLKNDLVRL